MSEQDSGPATWADRCIVVIAMLLPSLITWVYFVWLAERPSSRQQFAFTIGKTAQFALPVVWVAWVQRRRWSPRPLRWQGCGLGIAFGLAVMAGLVALYYGVLQPYGILGDSRTRITQKVLQFGITSPLAYLGLALFYSFVHSGLEEYYWRWFVFGQLARFQPLTRSIFFSSVAFMAHHVILLATFFGWTSPLMYLASIAVAVGGAFWAWLYHRSQSIYAPWVSHLLVDAAIFLVGYDMVRGVFPPATP